MRTERAKKNWVKAYIYVKLAELALVCVAWVGGDVLYASGMDRDLLDPLWTVLLWAALVWEVVYWVYRAIFLYAGVRFRIPMTLLTIVSIPGWYALFSDFLDFKILQLERLITHRMWYLPALTPLMVLLTFCFDINIMSKITEKEEKERKENAQEKAL